MRSPHSSNSTAQRARTRTGVRNKAAGFTLIELMIGVLIGLLASLAVTQIMINSEGQKRTTTAGSDAQVNGALALSGLQRAIQSAGYGFAANPASLGCPLGFPAFAGPPPFPTNLVPVFITAGAAGAPDMIRVIASGKNSYSIPLRVVAPGYNPGSGTINTQFPVAAVASVESADLMIAVKQDGSQCEVFLVTSDPPANPVVPRADNANWNSVGRPTAIYGDGDFLVNMGSFIDSTYRIGNDALQVRSLNIAADSTPSYPAASDLFPNVVNVKAQYGKDTDGDGVVDTWDTVNPPDTDPPATKNAKWKQVLAVRIAVVARSAQYEKEEITGAATVPTIAGPAKVDDIADWKHYRYKVFETVVPLRNMLWNS